MEPDCVVFFSVEDGVAQPGVRAHREVVRMRRVSRDREQLLGVGAALSAAVFLGWAPIFGKLAYDAGMTALTVVAVRTSLAAGLLWAFYLVFWREYIIITARELVGCMAVGLVNGIGSLFYYAALSRIDASLVSLINTTYPLWVVVFLAASGQPLSRFTGASLLLAGGGVALVSQAPGATTDTLGIMLMLVAAAAYGWHLVLGQWVVSDTPPRSVALYVLTTMAVVVGVARLVQAAPVEPITEAGWQAVAALGAVTALSRLFMFLGLERLGGIQTALLGLTELFVTLVAAFVLLGERLTPLQWLGGLLLISAGLVVRKDSRPTLTSEEWMSALEDEAERAQRTVASQTEHADDEE
jgi:drug/metabolite transporter (DMT)-like permease